MSHEPPPTRADMRQRLREELASLDLQSLRRVRPVIDSPCGRTIELAIDGERRTLVNWASNDYLGAATTRSVRNAAVRAVRSWGSGSGAARLLGGGLGLHRRFEGRIARWLGCEDALLTTTGFQANLAAIGALAQDPESVVILDRLCHASSYDGARLCGGTLQRFAHNDPLDLERQLVRSSGASLRVVVVESVYSMDGDEAPLAAIEAACQKHGALLLVDEAHAIGVLGPGGRGLCAELGVVPDLRVGTCSKSLGAQGGFIAGSSGLVELVVNRGRGFIFSTAPVPAAIGAALGTLDLLKARPAMPRMLLESAQLLRGGLIQQGWNVPAGRSPIIPVVIGGEAEALALAARLRQAGHYAPAIRPPTVPAGSCRLRLSVSLGHKPHDWRRLLAVMARLRQDFAGTPTPPPAPQPGPA